MLPCYRTFHHRSVTVLVGTGELAACAWTVAPTRAILSASCGATSASLEQDWGDTPLAVRTALLALQQQVRLMGIRFTAYEKQLAGLREQVTQVDDLKAEIAELRERLGQNSSNSSRPPSSDPPSYKPQPRREPKGRKRGGQPGHQGSARGSCRSTKSITSSNSSPPPALVAAAGCAALTLSRSGAKSLRCHPSGSR